MLLSLKNESTIVFDNIHCVVLFSKSIWEKILLFFENIAVEKWFFDNAQFLKKVIRLMTVTLQKLSKAPKTGSEINQYYLLIS
jgi:hypothetical protein